MAKGKNSFMFYCDWKETFDALPDEKAGQLIKFIFSYVNDEDPQTDDILIQVVFANIRATLKRDLKKWEEKSQKNRENAKKRWNANASERIKRNANYADSDSVSDKDSDSVKVNKSIQDRKEEFRKSLLPFTDKYKSYTLNEFYDYWTEHNENGKKMRFEYSKNQPFNISRRLATWYKRQKEFEKEKKCSSQKKENAGEMLIQKYGLSKT